MNLGFDKHLTPAERFIIYFKQAKVNYELLNDCKNATHKSILEWYNKKYKASLSEASLSKYLRGTNEIPIEVYVNMKELAGVEDVYVGTSASRTDYEISSDLNESLLFVKEEIEFMCRLEELEGVGGDSINDIMQVFVHYCESAARKDYHKGIELLHELERKILFNENKIKSVIANKTNSNALNCRTNYYAENCRVEQLTGDSCIDEYANKGNEHCHYWYEQTEAMIIYEPRWHNTNNDTDGSNLSVSSSINNSNLTQSKYVDGEARKETREDNVLNKRLFSNIMLDLEIMADRYSNLYHLIHRCIYLQEKIDADIYMDIPVMEENEILRSLKPLAEAKLL